jgi:hypothetical protein
MFDDVFATATQQLDVELEILTTQLGLKGSVIECCFVAVHWSFGCFRDFLPFLFVVVGVVFAVMRQIAIVLSLLAESNCKLLSEAGKNNLHVHKIYKSTFRLNQLRYRI